MKIATWNVNSIKARLPTVLEVLDAINCDVVCLQEIKCETNAFPYMELEERGWNCEVLGQKSYNGVALLSKHEIEDVTKEAMYLCAGDAKGTHVVAIADKDPERTNEERMHWATAVTVRTIVAERKGEKPILKDVTIDATEAELAWARARLVPCCWPRTGACALRRSA